MLDLHGVSRTFRGGGGVVDVTLRVDRGEVVALVGLNGAGKTTLMRLVLGMLRPRRGKVRIFGHPVDALPGPAWAGVGALVDVPLAYPELTVRANLHIASLLHRAAPGSVKESLETWGLEPVADRRFRRLSLGNRQRVGLASVLQHDPRLIVLDEPSSALDPASVILLRDQVRDRAEKGAAVLVSSHHLDEVARIADRVLLMNAGRLIGTLDPGGVDLERAFFERVRADDEQRLRTLGEVLE